MQRTILAVVLILVTAIAHAQGKPKEIEAIVRGIFQNGLRLEIVEDGKTYMLHADRVDGEKEVPKNATVRLRAVNAQGVCILTYRPFNAKPGDKPKTMKILVSKKEEVKAGE